MLFSCTVFVPLSGLSIVILKVMLVVYMSSRKYVSIDDVSHQTEELFLKFISFIYWRIPRRSESNTVSLANRMAGCRGMYASLKHESNVYRKFKTLLS